VWRYDTQLDAKMQAGPSAAASTPRTVVASTSQPPTEGGRPPTAATNPGLRTPSIAAAAHPLWLEEHIERAAPPGVRAPPNRP